jgi:hypothetical protein
MVENADTRIIYVDSPAFGALSVFASTLTSNAATRMN